MCSKSPLLPDREAEKMPDAPPGYFLCSGSGLRPGAPDTGSEFPNSPWAALSVCRTQDSAF